MVDVNSTTSWDDGMIRIAKSKDGVDLVLHVPNFLGSRDHVRILPLVFHVLMSSRINFLLPSRNLEKQSSPHTVRQLTRTNGT